MIDYPPIELVKYAAEKLGDIGSKFVFLGGSVVGLLVSEPGTRPPRATNDVDVSVEASTLAEFYSLDQALLSKGFINDMDGPMCRYLHGLLKLDVVPVNPDVLGFTNRWYRLASETAEPHTFETGATINLITPACFLATKMEAFGNPHREGHDDIFTSRDFQDIVTVIDGRSSVVDEVLASRIEVRNFVRDEITRILEQRYLEEAIAQYVDDGRVRIVVERLRSIATHPIDASDRRT